MERQNQEPALPDNNEEVIQMLGLDGCADINTASKLLDDIVKTLNLECYNLTPSSVPVPVAAIGFESVQGELVGNALGTDQPTETISYIDLSPVTPPGVENSSYHVSGGCVYINEANSPQASPQSASIYEDISPPGSPQEVTSEENEDTRKPAGGKTTKRRRELKPKLYQREEPLSDPVEEKKRLNAINAKKNRDAKKSKQQELDDQVKSLTAERDALLASNTKLRNKCESFERQLKTVCQRFNVPVIILPE